MVYSDKSKRWIMDICDSWKFKYFEKHAGDQEFLNTDYNDDDWDEIRNPMIWEQNGYGNTDKNCENTLKNLSRKINKTTGIFDKPVDTGYYRKIVEIPSSWAGREVYLKVGGVKSSLEIWVNGSPAGFSYGTTADLDFNISGFLNKGSNLIGLKIQKHSNTSFMDCSLEWFMSGLLRGIELYSEPEIHIKDVFLRSTFDDEYEDARLCVETWVENSTAENGDLKLELKIEGKLLMTAGFVVNKNSEEKVYICKLVENPVKWDVENPCIYEVDLILKDNQDKILSERRINHGFRQVEIRKSQFLVNGNPVLFKGVNWVDLDIIWGADSALEDMEETMKLLKRNNINAILASDFPSDSRLYEICDKLGIFVVSELGINTSPSIKKLPEGFDWTGQALKRISNTVKRDRNHPSIIMWYLGKDTGCGLNYLEIKDYLDNLDDSRPTSYVGSKGSIGGDVLCTVFPTLDMEKKIGELKSVKNFFKDTTSISESKSLKLGEYIKKPVFCSKLSYIGGNSLGNLYDHVINYEKYSNLCGGFISNLKDISVIRDGESMVEREGLIDALGRFKPMFYEVKKVFQNIQTVKREENGRIFLEIENKYRQLTFDDLIMEISIDENGAEIYKRDVLMDLRAEKGKTVFEFTPDIDIVKGCEYVLTVSWKLKYALPWAPEGYEIAWDQFVIFDTAYVANVEVDNEDEPFSVLETGEYISVKNSDFSIIINKKTGTIKNINLGQGNVLYREIFNRFDREDTDVDRRNEKNGLMNLLNRNNQWENAIKKKKVVNVFTEKYPEKVVVHFEIEYPMAKGPALLTYEIRNNCELVIFNEIEPDREFARFGMQFELAEQFDELKYYGKGPHENYMDRNRGALIGIHQSKLRDFNYDYINEQERGNRTDVRWLTFFNDINTISVEAIGEKYFDFSIVQGEEKTILNVDYGQKGVGGDTMTDTEILEKYRLNKNTRYKYAFRISFKGELYEV